MAYDNWVLDIALVPLGMTLIALYHVWLYFRIHRHPLETVVGVNHLNRRAWVHSIMKDQSAKGVLAAQTLRNSIQGSTLVATVAILLASAIATFISSTVSSNMRQVLQRIVVGAQSEAVLMVKWLCILLCFLFQFVCHVQSIRYSNHVVFIINIPLGPETPGLSPDYVSSVLARGSDFNTLGNRGFYFAFPFLIWIFGPVPMFLVCLALLPLMYRADQSKDFIDHMKRRADEEGPPVGASVAKSG